MFLVRIAAGGARAFVQARRAGRRRRAGRAARSAATRSTPTGTCACAPTASGAGTREPESSQRVLSRAGELVLHGRIMPASNATFLGADRRASGSSTSRSRGSGRCGTSPTAPSPTARWRRTSSPRRSAGTSCRRPCCATGRTAPAWCSSGRSRDRPEQEAVDLVRARARCRRAGCTSSTASTASDRAGLAGPRGLRAAAPDGGLRRRSSTTPTARAATCSRWPTATGTASTTASRFHVEHKLRTVLWGWLGEPLDRRRASPAVAARRATRAVRRASATARRHLTEPEIDALDAALPSGCSRAGRMPRPAASWPGDPVAAVLTADALALGFAACVRGRSRSVPRRCPRPGPAVRRSHDTATGEPGHDHGPDGPARLYVCGITPYDATHIGHAATYVALRPAQPGLAQRRATRSSTSRTSPTSTTRCSSAPTKVTSTGRELAERETELFRQDMAALRVLPPDHYIGAVESIPLRGRADRAAPGTPARSTGSRTTSTSRSPPTRRSARSPGCDRDRCSRSSPSAAATPTATGKKDPLDCVVWRGRARRASRAWDSPFGPGRPGWHIECTAIALEHLGDAFDVQGGGSDLVFPHHEMCAGHAQVADPGRRSRRSTCHAGMVGLRRREDVEVEGQPGLRLARCATATSTRWRSGWRCCATTTAPTGSGPTPSSGTPSTRLADWRRALLARRRRPGRPGRRRGARRAGRRPRRPARGRRRRGLGGRDPRRTGGLADDLDATPRRPRSTLRSGRSTPRARRSAARERSQVPGSGPSGLAVAARLR